jgi:hypothetical protein
VGGWEGTVRIRHVGLILKPEMRVSVYAEIEYLWKLGFRQISRKEETWAGRTLETYKFVGEDPKVMLELVYPEWVYKDEVAPHVCLEVDKWPKEVSLVEMHREPEDPDMEVRFTRSPSGKYYELVKRRTKK